MSQSSVLLQTAFVENVHSGKLGTTDFLFCGTTAQPFVLNIVSHGVHDNLGLNKLSHSGFLVAKTYDFKR